MTSFNVPQWFRMKTPSLAVRMRDDRKCLLYSGAGGKHSSPAGWRVRTTKWANYKSEGLFFFSFLFFASYSVALSSSKEKTELIEQVQTSLSNDLLISEIFGDLAIGLMRWSAHTNQVRKSVEKPRGRQGGQTRSNTRQGVVH